MVGHEDETGSSLIIASHPKIIRWDGRSWTTIASSISIGGGAVRSMASHDDGAGPALFAAGTFTSIDGVPSKYVARWDGTEWTEVGGGMSGYMMNTEVRKLHVHHGTGLDGPSLYASGSFSIAGGQPMSNIARWDGHEWLPLGEGVTDAALGLGSFDRGDGPELVVSGWFGGAGGYGIRHVALWNDEDWSPLGGGLSGMVLDLHHLLDEDDDRKDLIAAGAFSFVDGQQVNFVARRVHDTWFPMGDGFNRTVSSLGVFDDDAPDGAGLYAGGWFTASGATAIGQIARWDGRSWSAVGSGFSHEVRAMTVFDDGRGSALYVGGVFTHAGDEPIASIARWDGAQWSSVGGGTNGRVHALRVFDDGRGPALYAGGTFTMAGDVPARVARWDGESWEAVGSHLDGNIHAFGVLGESPARLVVGGAITSDDDEDIRSIARLIDGTWHPFGRGIAGHPFYSKLGSVYAIEDASRTTAERRLVVGGSFPRAPGGDTQLAVWCEHASPPCAADLTHSGGVSFGDLLVLLASWGPCEQCPADLNGNAAVDADDLLMLIAAWGPCPEA